MTLSYTHDHGLRLTKPETTITKVSTERVEHINYGVCISEAVSRRMAHSHPQRQQHDHDHPVCLRTVPVHAPPLLMPTVVA